MDGNADIEMMADEIVDCGGGRGTIYAALRDAYQMGKDGISYSELKRRQEEEFERYKAAHPDWAVI